MKVALVKQVWHLAITRFVESQGEIDFLWQYLLHTFLNERQLTSLTISSFKLSFTRPVLSSLNPRFTVDKPLVKV